MIAATQVASKAKWLVGAGLVVAVVIMWLVLKASNAENTNLSQQLKAEQEANAVNQLTISSLKHDQTYMNDLLVQRKRAEQQGKRKLHEQMEQLEKQMANTECHIPADVTNSLRQPY